MNETTLTLEKVLEDAGFYARAEEHKAIAIAQNMKNLGFSFETVVSATQLDPDKVRTLYINSDKP